MTAPIYAISDRAPEFPVEWLSDHEGKPLNYSNRYSVGNPFTGSVASGWCLYSMRGSCWNQVTKAAFPPKPGMVPAYVDTKWLWVFPDAPTAPGVRPEEADDLKQCEQDRVVLDAIGGYGSTPTATGDTPETDAFKAAHKFKSPSKKEWEKFARRLERERDRYKKSWHEGAKMWLEAQHAELIRERDELRRNLEIARRALAWVESETVVERDGLTGATAIEVAARPLRHDTVQAVLDALAETEASQ